MTKQDVLDDCRIEDKVVFLPNIDLERKLYMEVNKALQGAGGKWNRKAKGFVFPQDPAPLLGRVQAGEKVNLKKQFQAFYTPTAIAEKLVDGLKMKRGDVRVLEPSAGGGVLVDAVRGINPYAHITMVELNDLAFTGLLEKYSDKESMAFNKVDFLEWADQYEGMIHFDYIVANPPFTRGQDIKHFKSMYEVLKIGGAMAVIMSTGWITSPNKIPTDFSAFLRANDAHIEYLDEGTFKESGTNVVTCIVTLTKK
jgi:hypothetical protein